MRFKVGDIVRFKDPVLNEDFGEMEVVEMLGGITHFRMCGKTKRQGWQITIYSEDITPTKTQNLKNLYHEIQQGR